MSGQLPSCSFQYPTCGACGAETEWDEAGLSCFICDLSYGDGEDGTTATFRDEGAEPCGKPCTNPWHTDNGVSHYECQPCTLPDTHKDDCWTPCKCVINPKETP